MLGPFTGWLRWASNFWMCDVEFEGVIYPSVEHAFVAAKTDNPLIRKHVLMHCQTPGDAKRFGRKIKLRPNWNQIRIPIMRRLVEDKFRRNEDLRYRLLTTKDEELVEVNHWGDRFWGIYHGLGKNNLGKILMEVRKILREEENLK